jgi:hypothetical protein
MNCVVGTSLKFSFVNRRLVCPKNRLYGAKVKGFVVSKIHHFSEIKGQGNLWQLRSVQVGMDWFILPFILNTGGSPWNKPIISRQAMNKIGLEYVDKKTINSVENHSHLLRMPTPLGIIPSPLDFDWDEFRKDEIEDEDLSFNLVGQELAEILLTINAMNSIDMPAHVRNRISHQIAAEFEHVGATFESIEKEFDAMNSSRKSGNTWTSESLPFDNNIFHT